MSHKTISGRKVEAAAKAAGPSWTVCTVWPDNSSSMPSISAVATSSSTTSILSVKRAEDLCIGANLRPVQSVHRREALAGIGQVAVAVAVEIQSVAIEDQPNPGLRLRAEDQQAVLRGL